MRFLCLITSLLSMVSIKSYPFYNFISRIQKKKVKSCWNRGCGLWQDEGMNIMRSIVVKEYLSKVILRWQHSPELFLVMEFKTF